MRLIHFPCREQIRKEVINRPIGHVKPIQNVQASSSPPVGQPISSFPVPPLQPYANPFRADLPSMAYMAGMTLPPLLNNRYKFSVIW